MGVLRRGVGVGGGSYVGVVGVDAVFGCRMGVNVLG